MTSSLLGTLDLPAVTFGIIVLNGEPFIRYNLRALYPFAHEIIVVEGANPNSAANATPDGHSLDRTLEILRAFKAEEDPDNKVQIVTRDGFWSEKDEQSQAYAERATGEYLWQIDVDEFYKPEDIQAIMLRLKSDSDLTQVNVEWLTFWGGFDYLVDGLFLKAFHRRNRGVPRLFKWGKGYSYVTHRPPTVVDAAGRDLRSYKLLSGRELARQGIFCYHYSMCFPQQVEEKMAYYGGQGWRGHDRVEDWARSTFRLIKDPFQVHHIQEEASWLTRFKGSHPSQIQGLIRDLASGRLPMLQRSVDDIEHVLHSRRYRIGTSLLDRLSPLLLRLRERSPRLKQSIEDTMIRLFSPPKAMPTEDSASHSYSKDGADSHK